MRDKGKTKRSVVRNKQLGIIAVCIVLLVAVTAGLTTRSILASLKEFPGDGYILVPSDKADVTTEVNEQYYFSAGTSYRERLASTVSFKDTSDHKVTTDTTEFVHYLDGSLGSFTKGVVLELTDVANDQVTYYGVSDKTTIVKNGQNYAVSYMGDALDMGEFIWKITDDKYMLVSPQITLHLNQDTDVTLDDYVQLQYVEGGIVRLAHQQGTYQTVSDNAYLTTDSGVQLNLMSKSFMVNGEEALSLNDMVIDASSNLNLDEDEDTVKIPSFNVVNGKDGASGTSGDKGEEGEKGEAGEEGEAGDKGDEGTIGETGSEGVTGGNGAEGADGGEGQDAKDGFDGLEGTSGSLGYDGKDGEVGADAPTSTSTDGIAAIDQKQAPVVSLDTEKYTVGPNSISFNLAINDPEGMLESDLLLNIYNRADMSVAYQQTIPRGATSAAVNTNALLPDTEYVIVVSGSYSTDSGLFDTDFFTKVFATDSLGIKLEKVQITENSIKVKTTMSEDSMVGTYQLALYDSDGVTKISSYNASYSDGQEFEFSTLRGLESGRSISSNTKYTVKLLNIVSKESAAIGADVALDVLSLKATPHYLDGEGNSVDIAQVQAKAVTSERFQNVTVSIDTAIKDSDKGITGYRYELYRSSDIAHDSKPVATQEVQGMQPVSFDVDQNQGYVARVVVLFNDNEKEVELPSAFSELASLSDRAVPNVTFEEVTRNYDSIQGYIRIIDTQQLLLTNISHDYPLMVSAASEAGGTKTMTFDTATYVQEGNSTTEARFYFEFDGLRRNTVYAVSVLGPYNDSDLSWGGMSDDQKKVYAKYYLSGININTGAPSTLAARFRQTSAVDDGLFAIQFGLTAASVGEENDAAYEVRNLEKVSFRLINRDNGVVLGEGTLKDLNSERHASDFSKIYSDANTISENQKYDSQFVLTANTFNANDSRVSGGGHFRIEVVQGLDYTKDLYNSNYTSNGTNIMEWDDEVTEDKDNIGINFDLEASHVQTDPNNAVGVVPIRNGDAGEHAVVGLSDDTVVGLKITPDYRWDDALSVTYSIYEVTGDGTQPVIGDTLLSKANWIYNTSGDPIPPIATKTIQIASGAPGRSISPWVVYFGDTSDPTSITSNLGNPDGSGNCPVIFERGKRYFVCYRVKTDRTLSDSRNQPYYPDCVYPGMGENNIPYYRSQMFALERQIPKIQRYLYDTKTDASNGTTQTWMYMLVDPDGAVKAYADKNSSGTPQAKVIKYDTYPSGIVDENGSDGGTELTTLSLADLYQTDGTLKTTYTSLDIPVGTITGEIFYGVEIPYLLYTNADAPGEDGTAAITKLVEKPVSVKPVSEINTDIIDSSIADPKHPTGKDYLVDGLMVKGLGVDPGIEDQNGYRIKLTLQGKDIFQVAALRVTLTDTNTDESIVFDPVEIQIAMGQAGDNVKNNYGYAYLDYAPIVRAVLSSKNVRVKVEAYYHTNRCGVKRMNEFSDTAAIDHTGGTFIAASDGKAWALKRTSYITSDGGNSCEQVYLKLDANGNLVNSVQVKESTASNAAVIQTAIGSVFLSKEEYNGTDKKQFVLQGAMAPLCTTGHSGTDMYMDILKDSTVDTIPDDIGALVSDNEYYVVEELAVKPLQIDIGESTDSYQSALFTTGDGMPGIKKDDAGCSIGRNSATLRFTTKGQVPNAADEGLYIYLYKGNGTPVAMNKYKDVNGVIFYQSESKPYEGFTLLADKDDGTRENDEALETNGTFAYGTPIHKDDVNSIDGDVSFILQGLDAGTKYYVMICTKNTSGTIQELFDYGREAGGIHYEFTTSDNVELEVDPPTWNYSTYQGKLGVMRFAIKGYDGMNMRIYYKVFDDANGQEVLMNAERVGPTYVAGKGYRLEPLGNLAPYYDCDKEQNDPINIDFSPGTLRLGNTYKVVVTAYDSDLHGNNVTNNDIGKQILSITTPDSMSAPYASVRAIPKENGTKADLTVIMTDVNRVIYNDTYQVQILDKNNHVVWEQVDGVSMDQGSPRTWTGTATGLAPDTSYRVKVTAKVDINNDGVAEDPNTYTTYTTINTTTEPTANIITSRDSGGNLVLEFTNPSNFENVAKIMYSIDSSDGTSNYANGEVDTSSYGGKIVISGVPTGNTLHYSIQYYDASNNYLGGTNADFK